MMVESLKENLALGNYEKVRKLVRFLADLVNSKVVASASIMSLFDTFITVTYEPDIPQVSVLVYLCGCLYPCLCMVYVCPCVCTCMHTHACSCVQMCDRGCVYCMYTPADTIGLVCILCGVSITMGWEGTSGKEET